MPTIPQDLITALNSDRYPIHPKKGTGPFANSVNAEDDIDGVYYISDKETTLLAYVVHRNHVTLIRDLINAGASVKPLFEAGNYEAIQQLLNKGIAVDAIKQHLPNDNELSKIDRFILVADSMLQNSNSSASASNLANALEGIQLAEIKAIRDKLISEGDKQYEGDELKRLLEDVNNCLMPIKQLHSAATAAATATPTATYKLANDGIIQAHELRGKHPIGSGHNGSATRYVYTGNDDRVKQFCKKISRNGKDYYYLVVKVANDQQSLETRAEFDNATMFSGDSPNSGYNHAIGGILNDDGEQKIVIVCQLEAYDVEFDRNGNPTPISSNASKYVTELQREPADPFNPKNPSHDKEMMTAQVAVSTYRSLDSTHQHGFVHLDFTGDNTFIADARPDEEGIASVRAAAVGDYAFSKPIDAQGVYHQEQFPSRGNRARMSKERMKQVTDITATSDMFAYRMFLLETVANMVGKDIMFVIVPPRSTLDAAHLVNDNGDKAALEQYINHMEAEIPNLPNVSDEQKAQATRMLTTYKEFILAAPEPSADLEARQADKQQLEQAHNQYLINCFQHQVTLYQDHQNPQRLYVAAKRFLATPINRETLTDEQRVTYEAIETQMQVMRYESVTNDECAQLISAMQAPSLDTSLENPFTSKTPTASTADLMRAMQQAANGAGLDAGDEPPEPADTAPDDVENDTVPEPPVPTATVDGVAVDATASASTGDELTEQDLAALQDNIDAMDDLFDPAEPAPTDHTTSTSDSGETSRASPDDIDASPAETTDDSTPTVDDGPPANTAPAEPPVPAGGATATNEQLLTLESSQDDVSAKYPKLINRVNEFSGALTGFMNSLPDLIKYLDPDGNEEWKQLLSDEGKRQLRESCDALQVMHDKLAILLKDPAFVNGNSLQKMKLINEWTNNHHAEYTKAAAIYSSHYKNITLALEHIDNHLTERNPDQGLPVFKKGDPATGQGDITIFSQIITPPQYLPRVKMLADGIKDAYKKQPDIAEQIAAITNFDQSTIQALAENTTAANNAISTANDNPYRLLSDEIKDQYAKAEIQKIQDQISELRQYREKQTKRGKRIDRSKIAKEKSKACDRIIVILEDNNLSTKEKLEKLEEINRHQDEWAIITEHARSANESEKTKLQTVSEELLRIYTTLDAMGASDKPTAAASTPERTPPAATVAPEPAPDTPTAAASATTVAAAAAPDSADESAAAADATNNQNQELSIDELYGQNNPEGLAGLIHDQTIIAFLNLSDDDLTELSKSESFGAILKEIDAIQHEVLMFILDTDDKDINERAKRIKFGIEALKSALKNNDHYTASTLLFALNATNINKLSGTQALISEEDRELLSILSAVYGRGGAGLEAGIKHTAEANEHYVPLFNILKKAYQFHGADKIDEQTNYICRSVLRQTEFSDTEPAKTIAKSLKTKHILQRFDSKKSENTSLTDEQVIDLIVNELIDEFTPLIDAYKVAAASNTTLSSDDKTAIAGITAESYKKQLVKILKEAAALTKTKEETKHLHQQYATHIANHVNDPTARFNARKRDYNEIDYNKRCDALRAAEENMGYTHTPEVRIFSLDDDPSIYTYNAIPASVRIGLAEFQLRRANNDANAMTGRLKEIAERKVKTLNVLISQILHPSIPQDLLKLLAEAKLIAVIGDISNITSLESVIDKLAENDCKLFKEQCLGWKDVNIDVLIVAANNQGITSANYQALLKAHQKHLEQEHLEKLTNTLKSNNLITDEQNPESLTQLAELLTANNGKLLVKCLKEDIDLSDISKHLLAQPHDNTNDDALYIWVKKHQQNDQLAELIALDPERFMPGNFKINRKHANGKNRRGVIALLREVNDILAENANDYISAARNEPDQTTRAERVAALVAMSTNNSLKGRLTTSQLSEIKTLQREVSPASPARDAAAASTDLPDPDAWFDLPTDDDAPSDSPDEPAASPAAADQARPSAAASPAATASQPTAAETEAAPTPLRDEIQRIIDKIDGMGHASHAKQVRYQAMRTALAALKDDPIIQHLDGQGDRPDPLDAAKLINLTNMLGASNEKSGRDSFYRYRVNHDAARVPELAVPLNQLISHIAQAAEDAKCDPVANEIVRLRSDMNTNVDAKLRAILNSDTTDKQLFANVSLQAFRKSQIESEQVPLSELAETMVRDPDKLKGHFTPLMQSAAALHLLLNPPMNVDANSLTRLFIKSTNQLEPEDLRALLNKVDALDLRLSDNYQPLRNYLLEQKESLNAYDKANQTSAYIDAISSVLNDFIDDMNQMTAALKQTAETNGVSVTSVSLFQRPPLEHVEPISRATRVNERGNPMM